MAARTFTITELVKTAVADPGITDGAGFASTGVRFEWSATQQSSPRNVWEFGLKQRTKRDDYPGCDEPVEQILGPNFKPFTLEGVWDDRYMGAGKAGETWRAFEQLVQRGSTCRFEIEDVSITGVITETDFQWFRAWRIGYKFTVSPHYRVAGGDVRRQRRLAPEVTQSPKGYAANVRAIAERALAAHAQAPTTVARAGVVASVGARMSDVFATIDVIDSAIVQRTAAVSVAPVQPIARVVQGFTALRGQSFALQSTARALVTFGSSSTAVLAFDDALAQLGAETWARDVAFAAAQLAFESFNAARDLRRFMSSAVLATYTPYEGESLYSISLRFYGTPHEARRIMEHNRITTLPLVGGVAIEIPNKG